MKLHINDDVSNTDSLFNQKKQRIIDFLNTNTNPRNPGWSSWV